MYHGFSMLVLGNVATALESCRLQLGPPQTIQNAKHQLQLDEKIPQNPAKENEADDKVGNKQCSV